MGYMVHHNGELSEEFKSTIGLLTGDTASPILWNLYFADVILPEDENDVTLGISHVEQADDVVLFSTTAAGLQQKLHAFFVWCGRNFMVISVRKTKWMLFGPFPHVLPSITVNGAAIQLVEDYKYVGIRFVSTHRCIFAKHYKVKAFKARDIANATFAVEGLIGSLPPADACILYMARVDPHLTFGAEVTK